MAMSFSNNKQIYPYAYFDSFVCFTVEKFQLPMIQICFENIKPSKRVLSGKERYLKSCKLNVVKHELVDSADAYKDDDWQEI